MDTESRTCRASSRKDCPRLSVFVALRLRSSTLSEAFHQRRPVSPADLTNHNRQQLVIWRQGHCQARRCQWNRQAER